MRKILLAVIAAIVLIGSGAFFGWDLWAQFRSKAEVERVFTSLRTAFGSVTYGRIELFPKTRSFRISNIVLQSHDRTTTIKIGQLLAVGTRGPVAGRISAGRIEIANWEISAVFPAAAAELSYKAPSIVIEAFTGPGEIPFKADAATALDVTRASLEYAAASTANSIKIPKLVANIVPGKSGPAGRAVAPVEYTYSDILLRTIRDQRIAAITVERTTVTSEAVHPELGSFAGVMAGMSITELDLGAMVAFFDPSRAKTDGYLTIYRQASMGRFEFRFARGGGIQMDGMIAEDIGVRPSKLSVASLLELVENAPRPGVVPTPEQLRAMLDRFAQIYEGIRIGRFEMRGLRARVPPDVRFDLGTIRLAGMENGRLEEFAVEGLEGRSPQNEPFSLGRFALKGVHFAKGIRLGGGLTVGGAKPTPDRLAEALALLEGVEVENLNVVPKGKRQAVRIENFRIAWGKFVGTIPSSIRVSAKTTVPTDLADMGVGGVLSDAGLATITTRLDLGVDWDETTLTLAVAPAVFEIENAFTFSAEIAVHNVARSMFAPDPLVVLAAAEELEPGPIRFSLRDTGAVRTALAQYAKTKAISVEEARKQIIESVHAFAKTAPQPAADAEAFARGVVKFIETPGSTLTVTVTPKERLKVKDLIAKSNADPAAAASLFTVEVNVSQ